ncbi:MAG: hypothetical protein JOZ36_17110 [Acidobacteria bacterium]|nr:hypothetical protein [Acidobacteriota bacterium]
MRFSPFLEVKVKHATIVTVTLCSLLRFAATCIWAQGIPPYPKAVTGKAVLHETSMLPPPVNAPFTDPDFGETIVRITGPSTNGFDPQRTFFRTEASGEENEWNVDSTKFYVFATGGHNLAFGFDPSIMAVRSLPGALPGYGLEIPFGPGPTFSFADPDLIYGTPVQHGLIISSFRFSTRQIVPIIDTTTCGTVPAIGAGSGSLVSNDGDLSLSADDSRMSISEVGTQYGATMVIIVYDRKRGCRWYNTQTGQIGGRWGARGTAMGPTMPYYVQRAKLSLSGNYMKIQATSGNYFWDISTLNVSYCRKASGWHCSGYDAIGYNNMVNAAGAVDEMNIIKHPLRNPADIEPLVWPLTPPYHWDQEHHFSWNNVDAADSRPVCLSNYNYEGDPTINNAYDNEIVCVETDLVRSTVWRFAHHRAIWLSPWFNSQPLGTVSKDGRFFLFTSSWDLQVGWLINGAPRSDVWIVHLE